MGVIHLYLKQEQPFHTFLPINKKYPLETGTEFKNQIGNIEYSKLELSTTVKCFTKFLHMTFCYIRKKGIQA